MRLWSGPREREDGRLTVTAGEKAVINQLLGRIVYVHVLFIEPCKPASAFSGLDLGWPQCCNHAVSGRPGRSMWQHVGETAWSALLEVSTSLPEASRCRSQPDDCCATCVVGLSGASIAGRWISTEEDAYGRQHRSPFARPWSLLAGTRLAQAFAHQHNVPCCARMTDVDTDIRPPTDLPLTGELLALWADPLRTDQAPVVTWLNHCTGLADVARIVESRRTER
jgi:hypothetical protein